MDRQTRDGKERVVQTDGAEHIGYTPVILDESRFMDESGKSREDRRSIPDRRADIKDSSPFAHLRNALRRKDDRDMVEYLRDFSGDWGDIDFVAT